MKNKKEKFTLGVISLICGVIGIFTMAFGLILGLIGLILGIIAWRKKESKVYYIIGITTSIIALVLSFAVWGVVILALIGLSL